MISIWHGITLIKKLEIFLKKRYLVLTAFKASIAVLFFTHWVTCLWLFLVTTIEAKEVQTWATLLNLSSRPVFE